MNPGEYIFDIKTGYQKGFEWYNSERTWFIGYFFTEDSEYIEGEEALKYITNLILRSDYPKAITGLNGVYSLIVLINNELILYSDKSRFFPLFYTLINNKIIVSDDFYYLMDQQTEISFNRDALTQFLSGAFVCGNDTIIRNINQVRPSEIIVITKESIQKKYTSTFSTQNEDILSGDESYLEKLAYEKFENAGNRLSNSLKNKHILLPLSGGYDSRLIACWLKNHNIKNVTCFTFGRKGTADVGISEKVAKQLGFEWHYIEYNKKMLETDYLNDNEFKEYYKYASRGTSMFYMQEYFALKELARRKIIDKDFVALPGHSGDFLGGSQLYKVIPPETIIKNMEKILLKKSFWQEPTSSEEKKYLSGLIQEQITEIKNTFHSDIDYSIIEDWLIKERIIKYVFNSSHIFTFFNGEIRLPFWDTELYEFWKRVPLDFRLFKQLYNKILVEKYFIPHSVEFGQQLQPSKNDLFKQALKSSVKQYLPLSIKNKYRKKNDWVLYDEITQPMVQELKKSSVKIKDNGLSYANRILNWYLMKIGDEFRIIRIR